ncbi:hypothetical protein [Streptacidiphilus sp. PAMC 29251]
MTLTYRELLGETRELARAVRKEARANGELAALMIHQAETTGRTAEQIATLHVDSATVAETNEVARIMIGLSVAALAYANATDEAARAAVAAEQQNVTDHGGIQEARDRSPVEMADRDWYRQE